MPAPPPIHHGYSLPLLPPLTGLSLTHTTHPFPHRQTHVHTPHALSLSRGRFRALFRLDEVPIEHFWKFLGLSMLSGASSGAVCLAVLYPLDFARTRVGTDVRSSGNRQFTGSIDCLRQAYSTVVSLESWVVGLGRRGRRKLASTAFFCVLSKHVLPRGKRC